MRCSAATRGTNDQRRRAMTLLGTVPARPLTAEAAALLTDELRAAVLDVLAEWDRSPEREASVEAAARELTLLAGAVRACADGNLGEAEALPRTEQAQQLLQLLRRAFVERLHRLPVTPDGTVLLEVFAAMETVGGVLARNGGGAGLAAQLSGPDGAELLVEVAHDLRSPLTAILFLAETLLRGRSGPVNAVQERQLGLIYSAAFGLSSIASDVLELVRGSERLLDLEAAPFSLTELLEQVSGMVRPMAEEKGLALDVECPIASLRVGQQVALTRVLLNLTTNAIKFTNQGRVAVGVRAVDARRVEFSVQDTGRGIPPAAMATLFEPFRRRADARHRFAFSGSGLGLSICKRFVESMGAALEVETAPGVGTRFYFVLDLPPAELSPR